MDRKFKLEISQGKLGSARTKPRNNSIFIKSKRGQASTLEMVIFIVCVVVALVVMQPYIKRAIQGKLRESADGIGAQYDPKKTKVNFVTTSSSLTRTNVTVGINIGPVTNTTWATTQVNTIYDNTFRQGEEIVGAF